jgi:hypothetical protein
MPVTIKVNGRHNSLVHKGSGHFSKATIPDVCKTPTPGGPVPIPYPNISFSSSLSKGTKTVKADSGNMIAIKGSEFSISTGDEPGTVGGVKSNTFKKESTWITYSFNVKMEGQGACRLTDKKFQNHENTVDIMGTGGVPVGLEPWEYEYLCRIYCFCLRQWSAQKSEAEIGGLMQIAKLEQFGARQPRPPGRFERQGCVEQELRQANSPRMRPEDPYTINGRTRIPDVSVFDGTGKLTCLVEMKFPGDKWQKGQKADYKKIAKANNAKLVRLDNKSCKCAKR